MTIASSSTAESNRVVETLSKHFELCDLGPIAWLLGIEISRVCRLPYFAFKTPACPRHAGYIWICGLFLCADSYDIPNMHLSARDCSTTPVECEYVLQCALDRDLVESRLHQLNKTDPPESQVRTLQRSPTTELNPSSP